MPVHIECLRYADNHIIRAIKLVVLISYHCYSVNADKVCKVVAEQVPFLSVKSNLLTDSGIVADSSQGVNKVEHWFSVIIKDYERCVIEVSIANEILMHFRAQRKSSHDVSLSDYIDTGTDGTALSLMDVVSDAEDLTEQISNREQLQMVRQLVDTCLSEQERQVICLRYGLGGEKPQRQREVAKIVGISRSYVSRIEKRALEKLRHRLE